MRRTLKVALIAVAVMLMPLAVMANTITQTESVEFPTTTLTSGVTDIFSAAFADFNPADGTLDFVSLALSAAFTWASTASSPSLTVALNAPGDFAGGTFSTTSTGPISLTSITSTTFESNFAVLIGTGTFDTSLAIVTPDTGDTVTGNTPSYPGLSATVVYNYTPAVTAPEPSSVLLLAVVMLGALWVERKRLFARLPLQRD